VTVAAEHRRMLSALLMLLRVARALRWLGGACPSRTGRGGYKASLRSKLSSTSGLVKKPGFTHSNGSP
jgi:hypothetical protein